MDSANAISLHAPPVAYPELPPTGGKVGPEPEDFVVDEVPLYAASGKGEHQYLHVQKRLLATPDLLKRVARAAGVQERDIGFAGMKDKHAVTSQWLSVQSKTALTTELDLGPGAKVLEVTRHDNKLRTGHLLGNRFTITLVGVHTDALSRARAIAQRLARDGLPNYFGIQRFGHGGRNLPDALAFLARGGRSRNRFEQKLFPSVVQSELFNRYLTARLALGARQLILGEVVRLEGAGAMFRVEDVVREQPRLDARDLHLTGPLLGPKMRPASDEALALEQRLTAELGLDEAALGALGQNAPGARRDLFAPLELTLSEATDRPEPSLRLAFTLPAGGYATEVLRQLTHEPFSSGSGHVKPPPPGSAGERSTDDE
ncbi:MAG TPA: tRNA pseudouridine(13) synthase TruD [Polyangiaceae bacterium]|nr:tRNA pseudouridine(13) synthase TruD [Polyangiaceae bacterium]